MIATIGGHIIDINGMTEWVLFNRLTKKLNPADFLLLTDSFMQLPNFLYTISLLILAFVHMNLWIKFAVPSGLYFFGQMMICFCFGIGDLKRLRYPLMYFFRYDLFIMPATFITCFFFLGWWTILIIPAYLFTNLISLLILTSKEKKYYKSHWNKRIGNYDIYINNAFFTAYKYCAIKYQLIQDFDLTDEEIENQDWLKPYDFMRANWDQMEDYFSGKAKNYWRTYLHIEK